MEVFNDVLTNQNKQGVARANRTKFWLESPRILFDKSRLNEFYPTYDMTLAEKLNSIVRLSIYVGIVLFLLMNNYNYLWIPILIAGFTIFIYKNQKDNVETFFSNYNEATQPIAFNQAVNDGVITPVKPTTDNPFMNFNQITDNRFRPAAQKSYNNDYVKHDIESKFHNNLYRNVDDIWSKQHGQREFYTMPNTTAVNDQTSFAKWLYNTGPTLKEDTTKGAPHWNPVDHLEPDSTC